VRLFVHGCHHAYPQPIVSTGGEDDVTAIAQARRQCADEPWDRVRPVLIIVVAVWVIAWAATLYMALTTPWPSSGEAPTQQQVHEALSKVRVSAVVGIALPALGFALAAWCRKEVAAVLLAGCAFVAVLLTGLLHNSVT
jgi:predicted metal-binding membrane protein